MIDLDPILTRLHRASPPWDDEDALRVANDLSTEIYSFDPPDEEWVRFNGGMISTRYPLAFATAERTQPLQDDGVVVIPMTDFDTDEYRASREILEATLLPHGINDADFNTEAFSAGDLFVESV